MKLKKVVLMLIILVFILFGSVVFFYNYNLRSVSNDKTEKVVTINSGTISSIGKTLKENNLIRNELVFKLYLKINNINNLMASTYTFNEAMSLKEIVDVLVVGNSYNPNTISITFVEGKNMRYYANLISEYTSNSYDDVMEKVSDMEYIDSLISKYWFLTNDIKNNKIYYPLEGYLFPDTYSFLNKDVSVATIFETMLNETEKKLTPYKDVIDRLDLSVHEILTLASIVELEGAKANDRSQVAGVFYNRINDKWSLGSDVTTYYALKIDDFKVSLTSDNGLYKCDNAYNTRCNSFIGLPVGPICNPSLESIIATLEPNIHSYYYFVADCNGKVYLSKNQQEHFSIISKLKNENNWMCTE